MNTWSPLKKNTILLITEDCSAPVALERDLPEAQYDIVHATNCREGVEVFLKSVPDLVLLDVSESSTRLLQFGGMLSAEEPTERVPIVLLAGLEDLDAIRTGHQIGVTDLIVRPMPGQLLHHRLQYLLAASSERRCLARSLDRMEAAQRFARVGTWEWSPASRSLEFSEEARRILGFSASGSVATVDMVLRNVPKADRPRVHAWLEDASQSGIEGTIEHPITQLDGSNRVVRQRSTVTIDGSGKPKQISVVVCDVTEGHQAELENRYQARHDSVTGLENLARFVQRLEEATWLAQRTGGRFAVFYLGVARFGRIHESLGHRFGDGVLKTVGERLQKGLRKNDWVCTVAEENRIPRVARLDGAHFAILLQPIDRVEDMARLASRINEAFSDPIIWKGTELFLSTNIGISIYPDDGVESEELVRRAQTAMRRSQADGRSEPRFCTEQMTLEGAERLSLEAGLRHALALDQLEAYYQPKIEIATGRIGGMEALLRWNHPEHGLVPPGRFIPVAEETGVIVPMGEWVLRAACAQAKAWQDAGHAMFPLAVNVSVEQFRRVDIAKVVAQVLEETDLDPGWLEIELTESSLMGDTESNLVIMRELKELGVLLSVDDFGTGYSSLSYLRQFPIDILKIDRSFVIDLPGDADAAAIVMTILQMARSLGLKVIAEGVETEEQLAFLRGLGCDMYQGYLFSRPVPATVATSLLEMEGGVSGAA